MLKNLIGWTLIALCVGGLTGAAAIASKPAKATSAAYCVPAASYVVEGERGSIRECRMGGGVRCYVTDSGAIDCVQ